MFGECNIPYDWDNEDSEDYEQGWSPAASNTSTEEQDPTPWTYQSQWKLKGTPYWGQFATYWGGGEWLTVDMVNSLCQALGHTIERPFFDRLH